MCGIAGLVNFDNSYTDTIHQSLYHRGPDAKTQYQDKNLQLIHTRLSIQDIKNGNQPFVIGQYVIVFNGEIYNHLELRKRLKRHIFKTLSDTETLLALYIEYGPKALEMCDGMFAFIIYDQENNKLILARDRIGKKPLYLYRNGRKVFVVSELNALLHSIPELLIEEEAIASFIRVGFFHQNLTPYKDVEEVLPGHIYELNISSLSINKYRYFNILEQYKPDKVITHEEALLQLDSILNRSVKDRLLSSDLDVGAFLSSGIDSSLIVASASQYIDNLKTFTVKFDGSYDESPMAASTAKQFSTNHHELSISMNLNNDIEDILTAYGEPFMDSSAIPSYYVSREAKKYVTVVLNGDGADELFGGYRRYVPFANNWLNYAKYFSLLSLLLPDPQNKLKNYNYFYRLLTMSNKQGLDLYLSATTDIFEDVYKFGHNSKSHALEKYIGDLLNDQFSGLSKSLILDSCLLLPSDLLKKMDIATMSNSLEGRSPFLSKYMLEWAPKLPDQEKIHGLKTKYILRELAKKYSLSEIYYQPKRGFEVPLRDWIEKDLKDNIFDRLASNTYAQSFVSRKFIDNLLHENRAFSREKRAKMLWNLYSLEVWYANFQSYSSIQNNNIEIIKSAKKTNVLFLTTGLGLGGAERVVLDICKNIDRSKFGVSVMGISSQQELLEDFYNNKIISIVLNYKKNIRSFIGSIISVSRHLDNHEIKIIHAHMFHTLIIASLLKLFKPSLKIIFTPHNSFTSMTVRRLILWILKPFRNIDTIFSESAIKFFYKKEHSIIPNGIEVNNYKVSSKSKSNFPFTFIMIGRLEFMKNHKFIINIANQLKDYDFRIQIVGSGLMESLLRKQVSDLNLDKKIEFLGSRKDVPSLLNNSDCLILPSLWEAFPIVLLEAGACSIPVITTPVGSVPSLVDSSNGYVVNLENFKDAMIEVMCDYEKAILKSKKLFTKVNSSYHIKDIVKQYERLYQSFEQ